MPITLIDLGPEGGSAGGLVIAEGTPEQVAEVPGSFTGQYLKPLTGKRTRHCGRQHNNKKSAGA